MKTLLIILLALFLMSCKTHLVTNYQIVTKKRNYYTNNIVYKNDSIVFFETNRKGLPKASCKIAFKDSEIISK